MEAYYDGSMLWWKYVIMEVCYNGRMLWLNNIMKEVYYDILNPAWYRKAEYKIYLKTCLYTHKSFFKF